MEKINVAELLRNCPSGMELDCYLFNGLEFDHIDTDNEDYPIVCRVKSSSGEYYKHPFTKYGWYTAFFDYAKCVIFPKGKTTWEGFQRPFKDGDILFVDCSEEEDKSYQYIFILNNPEFYGKWHSYCHLDGLGYFHSKETYLTDDEYHPRFATEEEKQKLFDVIKDNGYRWNAETKTLEKLIEPKFKVGDTITNGKISITIGYIDNEYYYETSRNIANRLFIKEQDSWNLISEKFSNKPTALCDVINAINEGCKSLMEKTIKIDIPAGYEFAKVDDNTQQVVFTKIQPEYPKTYEECCEVLGVNPSFDIKMLEDEESTLYFNFIYLLRCRNAYWKIAGEQMGVDKPWVPNWSNSDEDKHCIEYSYGRIDPIVTTNIYNYILAFPTAEMRDAFYENFKDLIIECKELL